jgi:hypothetical protein
VVVFSLCVREQETPRVSRLWFDAHGFDRFTQRGDALNDAAKEEVAQECDRALGWHDQQAEDRREEHHLLCVWVAFLVIGL